MKKNLVNALEVAVLTRFSSNLVRMFVYLVTTLKVNLLLGHVCLPDTFLVKQEIK